MTDNDEAMERSDQSSREGVWDGIPKEEVKKHMAHLRAKLAEVEAERDEAVKWRDFYLKERNIERGTFFDRAGALWQPLYDYVSVERDTLQAQVTEARAALGAVMLSGSHEHARKIVGAYLTPTVSDAAQEGDK